MSMISNSDYSVLPGGAKRLQLIACKVLQREAYFCAARTKNVVDVVLMPQGLHNEPDKLRTEVQKALERTARSEPGCVLINQDTPGSVGGESLCVGADA